MKLVVSLSLFLLFVFNFQSEARDYNRRLPSVFVVDNFEDGNLDKKPEWWAFGNLRVAVVRNMLSSQNIKLEKKSARLEGNTSEWLIGGIGTYLALNATRYNHLKLVARGGGPNSGTIILEFYDDDNAVVIGKLVASKVFKCSCSLYLIMLFKNFL